MEGDDRGPAPEDRPPAPALYRRHAARLHPDLAPEVGAPLVGARDGATNRGDRKGRPYLAIRPVATPSTMSAARAAGTRDPISMIASRRANASTCRRRSGPSTRSGSSASASRALVQSRWRNSGTTFSPSTRLAKITEESRFAIARPSTRYSSGEIL